MTIFRWIISVPLGLLAGVVAVYTLPIVYDLMLSIARGGPDSDSFLSVLNGLIFVHGGAGCIAAWCAMLAAPSKKARAGFAVAAFYVLLFTVVVFAHPNPVSWKLVVSAVAIILGALFCTVGSGLRPASGP